MDHVLVCTKCGLRAGTYSLPRCTHCGSILEVTYNYKNVHLPRNFKKTVISHEKYLPFLPISSFRVGLKEGGTPLRRKRLGSPSEDIFLKMETLNPTRSFKDRGSAVEISRAVELGFENVVCASTGNMGLSVATYSKAAGITATIFISRDAKEAKIRKIKRTGAEVVKVDGDFNDALEEAELFSKKTGAFTCGDYHYRKEGQKTLAFEIIEQLGYNVPDYLFIPVGNATLFAGVYKGLQEFKKMGLIKKFPKLIAVQSEGCDPLVRACASGKALKYVRPDTIADAIAVGYPTFGFEGINAIARTKGDAISVPDSQLKNAVSTLKRLGVKSELGGAAAFAGYLKLKQEDECSLLGKTAVIVVSGNN